jgi:hypothetical protein
MLNGINYVMCRAGIFEFDSRRPWSLGKKCCIMFVVYNSGADFGFLLVLLSGLYADETWCITAVDHFSSVCSRDMVPNFVPVTMDV